MSDTVKPMAERVERGAEWLDANRPGWLNQIDLGELEMDNCSFCALGQVFGAFSIGCLELVGGEGYTNDYINAVATEHGFAASNLNGEGCRQSFWKALRDEWVTAILSRRFIAKHQQHGSSVPILDTAMSEVRA